MARARFCRPSFAVVHIAFLLGLAVLAFTALLAAQHGRLAVHVSRLDRPPVRRVCEIAAEARALNDRRGGGAHCAGDLGGPWAGLQE